MKKTFTIFIIILFSLYIFPTTAKSDNTNPEHLTQKGIQYYNEMKIYKARQYLEQAISLPFQDTKIQIQALRTLASIYKAFQEQEKTKKCLRKILELDHKYTPNPNDSPSIKKLYKIAKIEKQTQDRIVQSNSTKPKTKPRVKTAQKKQPGKSYKWLWISGGIVLTTAIVYILIPDKNQKTEEKQIPLPPGRDE